MKKLSDSLIFTRMANSPALMTKMRQVATNSSAIVTPKDFPNEFNSIERRINYSTKGAIMDKVNRGIITMVDDDSCKLPTFLTTVPGRGVNGDINIYVNISRYKTKTGEIYPKLLFAILQNALINYELLKNWDKYTNNIDLIKESAFIYSRITTKILDKVFALDLNEFNSDFMSYIFAKFFLQNMCDRKNDELNSQLAYKCCFNKSSQKLIEDFEKELADNHMDNMFALIESLKVVNSIKDINVRTFIENFVRMYGEPSLLLLDYLPVFYQSIFSACIGGNIVKDYMFESVCGNAINKAYLAFTKLLG